MNAYFISDFAGILAGRDIIHTTEVSTCTTWAYNYYDWQAASVVSPLPTLSSPSSLAQLFNSVQRRTLGSKTSAGYQEQLKVTNFLITPTYGCSSVRTSKEVKLVRW